MIRIDNRTVELTDAELEASRIFEVALDRGLTIYQAGNIVRAFRPSIDEEFVHYLTH